MIPKAFIFDLDGVLVDTARCHYEAWKEFADREGLQFDEKINQQLKGVSRQRSLELILQHNDALHRYSEREKQCLAELKNNRYIKMVKQLSEKDILPGIEVFLKQARAENIRLAVASASKNAKTVLKCIHLQDRFDYISNAEKIQNPKPHPEVFLDCAAALGVDPADCVGFEDAPAGIAAIHAAGMYAVGIGVLDPAQIPDIPLAQTAELHLDDILKKLEELPRKKA